ncbi:Beta-monoglucosyldiacylglycerol synthase [Anatilimnocola aggregata]|uniref:Beta-monoglucosyldiacylglycerol synthase n=1 Tax=Anatilimnocola aggregata TaxID=2528021 RepID=A0A517YD08_9BACT|nr:glycosyltransferase family 2 protein [Anatilimnocola aggregata]QDU28127.1 Beta-monoglucosyldiacylglycerol synthase [Anatilimnocola aggregata]
MSINASKDATKNASSTLSLIMPVRDCEATLGRQVARWLEIIPELTQRFELLIVDDGSADHTFEIAEDLSRQYPQVRALRNTVARGTQQAVRTGMEQARGEIVFVQDEQANISSNDLRRLWEMRQNQQLVMARTPSRVQNLSNELLDRLSQWGEALKVQANQTNEVASIHMIRRGAIDELRAGQIEPEMTLGKIPPVPVATVNDPATTIHSRADNVHQAGAPKRMGSFLSHLRELALGE